MKLPRALGLEPRGKLYLCPTAPAAPCGIYVIQGVRAGLGNVPDHPRRDVQMRRWVIPQDPKTDAQRARRLLFAIWVSNWQQLPPEEKKQWRDIGAARALPGFCAYLSHHLKQSA